MSPSTATTALTPQVTTTRSPGRKATYSDLSHKIKREDQVNKLKNFRMPANNVIQLLELRYKISITKRSECQAFQQQCAKAASAFNQETLRDALTDAKVHGTKY